MKAPSIPETVVNLGRVVELNTDTWIWTWNKKDNFIVCSDVAGKRLFIFPCPPRVNPDCKTGMQIQSIMFSTDKWTATKAKKWLTEHGYKTPKVDRSGKHLRFRQAPPSHFKKDTFRTKVFDKKRGIKSVMACPYQKYALNPGKTRGERLFKLFNRADPRESLRGKVVDRTKKTGKGVHIVYNSDKFGKRENYIHEFETAPTVWVDNAKKPRMIALTGGRIRITARGIEG